MPRQLVFASTPYQILNIFALVESRVIRPADAELFIVPVFSDAEGVSHRLESEHLFASVRILPRVEHGMPYPDYVQNMLASCRYEEIFCSFPHRAVAEMVSFCRSNVPACPLPDVVLFDDGIGSYVSDMLHSGTPELADIPVKEIHLSHPEMMLPSIRELYPRTVSLVVSPADPAVREVASRVFDARGADSTTAEIGTLYLSQPLESPYISHSAFETLLQAISSVSSDMLWRAHPRDTRCCPPGFSQANSSIPWELLCTTGAITENTVLVGEFSTAQFSPALLAGTFPHIVFTFEAISSPERPQLRRYHELVGLLSDIYEKGAHPNKIHLPKSTAETVQILASLCA